MKRNLDNVREQVLAIHIECFGEDDEYASLEKLEDYGIMVHELDDIVVGYLIYEESDEMLEGLRSGVSASARGKGIGKRLYKKMIGQAKRKQKVYYTYTSINNFTSINSHVQCGMRITKFINGWVCMSFTPPAVDLLEAHDS